MILEMAQRSPPVNPDFENNRNDHPLFAIAKAEPPFHHAPESRRGVRRQGRGKG
jgi:hypothetical protein